MYEAAIIMQLQLSDGDKDDDDENITSSDGTRVNVIIDPGHGGEDFGAVGVGGLYEKDVVLDISLKLRKILKNKYNLNAALTRNSDEFVPLYARTAFANDKNAQIFVSIHANASEKKNLQGFEVYYLDNTSDKASKKLADRENASMQFEGAEADLRYMLSDLIQDTKLQDSKNLAGVMNAEIISYISSSGGYKLKSHGIKKAPFYVLVGAFMPCILTEIGFIDHSAEGLKLADRKFRLSMAEAFAEGINKYINQSN